IHEASTRPCEHGLRQSLSLSRKNPGGIRPSTLRLIFPPPQTRDNKPPSPASTTMDNNYTGALTSVFKLVWNSTRRYLQSMGLGDFSPDALARLAAAAGQVATASLVARLPGVNEEVADSTSRWLQRRQGSLRSLYEVPTMSVATARSALSLDSPSGAVAHLTPTSVPGGIFIPAEWLILLGVPAFIICLLVLGLLLQIIPAGLLCKQIFGPVTRLWRHRQPETPAMANLPVERAAAAVEEVQERASGVERRPERADRERRQHEELIPSLIDFMAVFTDSLRARAPAPADAVGLHRPALPLFLAAPEQHSLDDVPVNFPGAPEDDVANSAVLDALAAPEPKTANGYYLDAVAEGADTLRALCSLGNPADPRSSSPPHLAPMRVLAAQQALLDSPALPRAPITPAAMMHSAPGDSLSFAASPPEDWGSADDWVDEDPFASPSSRASTSAAIPFVPKRFANSAGSSRHQTHERWDEGEEGKENEGPVREEEVVVEEVVARSDPKGKGRPVWRRKSTVQLYEI
ncbi:hypothetical protein C8R46DRAFT_1252077, partial [Mycena filopes]